MPRDDTPMTLKIDKGVRAARGGNETRDRLEAVVTIPGRTSLRFSDARMTVVDNARYEPEQILLIIEKALERRGVLTYVYKGLGFFEAAEIQDAVALIRHLADPSSNLRAAAFLRSRVVRLSDAAVARLAPDLAAALLGAELPDVVASFGEEDRAVFERVYGQLPVWRSWVDRLTPSELLSAVLAETEIVAHGRAGDR